MKKPTSIHKTFRALRSLPLEVSFAQVKEWVSNSPPIAYRPAQKQKAWWQKWFPKPSQN